MQAWGWNPRALTPENPMIASTKPSKRHNIATVILPDGKEAVRTSTGRIYPFAIVGVCTEVEAIAAEARVAAMREALTPADVSRHDAWVDRYEAAEKAYKARNAEVEKAGGQSWHDGESRRLLDAWCAVGNDGKKGRAYALFGHQRSTAEKHFEGAACTARHHREQVGKVYVVGWSQSRENAEKTAGSERSRFPGRSVRVMPTTVIPKLP